MVYTEQHLPCTLRWEKGNRCQLDHGECSGNGCCRGVMFYPALEIGSYKGNEIRSWGKLTRINKYDAIYRLWNGAFVFSPCFLLVSNHFCGLFMWLMCNYTSVILEMGITADERTEKAKMFLILFLVCFQPPPHVMICIYVVFWGRSVIRIIKSTRRKWSGCYSNL